MKNRRKNISILMLFMFLLTISTGSSVCAENTSTSTNKQLHPVQVRPLSPNRARRITVRPSPARVGEARPVAPAQRIEVDHIPEVEMSAPIPVERKIRVAPRRVRIAPVRPLTREEIAENIQILKSGQTMDARIHAATALGGAGMKEFIYADDPVVNDVYNALAGAFRENSDEELLRSIAISLGSLGKYEAGDLLIYYLTYNNSGGDVASAAIASLGRLKYREAVNKLIQILLYGNNPDLKARSAEALGMIGDDSASYALISALNEQDRFVVKAAIRALGEIGSREAENPLMNILNFEKDLALREAAARALRKIEDSTGYQ